MSQWGNILLNPMYQSYGSGITYLLKDEFTTARATGAVNGTAAEPGPGTRHVIDLDSRISLSGGAGVVAAGGTTDWNRTALWHDTPSVTREAGLVVIQAYNWSTIHTMRFHLSTTADGDLNGRRWVGLTASITGTISATGATAATSPDIFIASTGTAWRFFQVLRATGRFILVNSAGTVKLLWSDTWNATAVLYPGFVVQNNSVVLSFDDFDVISSPLYSVLATSSDSFNRADGAPGSTDGAGHAEANSGSGKAWADSVGTWAIASNKLACSALSGGLGICTVDLPNINQIVICQTTRSAGNFGLAGRYADANNFVYAYHDGTNITLRQIVAGVDSQLIAPTAATYAAGALMQLSFDGTTCWLYYNEVSINKATVNAALTGTRFGVYTSDTGNTFDNWRSFARGNAGEYVDLGAY